MGCELKDKGEIISERHKNKTELYLVNNSPSQIINFTVRLLEKTSSEKRYLSPKKSILDSDSTNETVVITLAPGARQYLATAHEADTLNLDARDRSFTYSTSTTPEQYSPQRKGIIITNKTRAFEIVVATAK